MKMKLRLSVVAASLMSTVAFAQNKALPQLGKSPIKEIIAAMTLMKK